MIPFETLVLAVLGVAWLAIVILGIQVISARRQCQRLEARCARLLRGTSGEGMERILLEQVDQIHRNKQELAALRREQDQIRATLGTAFTHTGLVRYNPYDDMGGNYSVALALADSTGRGLVLSTLHGRTATRVYARLLENWVSSTPMSTEEQEAVRQARHGSERAPSDAEPKAESHSRPVEAAESQSVLATD